MSAEIIPFDYEDHAVRVMLRDGEPWFVAADVCRVLEIVNTTQAVQRLDEDEVTLCQIEGSHRQTNLISESGLYALVLRSDKPAARRFRKWVTADVLPALRRRGRYEVPASGERAWPEPQDIGGLSLREAELWLSMVREARLTRGPRAAVALWDLSPLPRIGIGGYSDRADPDPQGCLRHLLTAETTYGRVIELARLAFDGHEDAAEELAACGMKASRTGLFVSNSHRRISAIFQGSAWSEGRHRTALRGLGEGRALPSVTRIGAEAMRGTLLDWTVIAGGADDE